MKLLCLCVMIMFCAVMASQIDPLYEFDTAKTLQKGLYLAGGISAGLDNALYDMDGKKIEDDNLKYTGSEIWIPLKIGYSFNEFISAGVVVPYYMPYHKFESDVISPYSEENSALSNPWVWGKCLFPIQEGFVLGPRLGIKLPFGAYTLEDDLDGKNFPADKFHALTGDKSLAVDLAALFTFHPPSTCFILDGQLAVRYSTMGTYDYIVRFDNIPEHDVQKITPGMNLALRLEPGFSWGANKEMGTFLAGYYTMQLTDSKLTATIDGTPLVDQTGSGMSMLSAGVGHYWALDAMNNLTVKFLYDIMSTASREDDQGTFSDSIPAGFAISLGYFGVLPL